MASHFGGNNSPMSAAEQESVPTIPKPNTKESSLRAKLVTVAPRGFETIPFPQNVTTLIENEGYIIESKNDLNNNNEINLIVITSDEDKEILIETSKYLRTLYQSSFICIWHHDATEDAFFRQNCFGIMNEYANMVSYDLNALKSCIQLISKTLNNSGQYQCPICKINGFTEDDLWYHYPLYHVNCENILMKCPICEKQCDGDFGIPFPVHLRNKHGPCFRGEIESEKHSGLYAIVVCRRPKDNKFLMVQEFGNSGFWLPGGQLDGGESLRKAIIRETMEEAGIHIKLIGVINVLSQARGRWRRIIFYAEPEEEEEIPKTLPDYESTGAVWVTLEEVNRNRSSLKKKRKENRLLNETLMLRGSEPLEWFNYINQGGEIFPLEIPERYKELLADVPF